MEKCGGLTINCIPNDISPSANALFVIGQVAIPFYTFASLFCLPVVAGLIAMFIPEFVAAATSMTAMHPASRAVTRTAKQHRPDHLIEEELWAIMRRQDVTDHRPSASSASSRPCAGSTLRVEYIKRAKEARRLRELTEAKITLEEETGLAQRVHELERKRRRLE